MDTQRIRIQVQERSEEMNVSKKINRLYKKVVARFRGIPVLVVVYKPWVKGKNVMYISGIPFDTDPYLIERFDEIAEHIRLEWQEPLDRIIEVVE